MPQATDVHAQLKAHLEAHRKEIERLQDKVNGEVHDKAIHPRLSELFERYKTQHSWFAHDVYGCVSGNP